MARWWDSLTKAGRRATSDGDWPELSVQAHLEPACLIDADGRLVCANPAWLEGFGAAVRPFRRLTGSHPTLRAALRDGRAEGELEVSGARRRLIAALMPGGRLLVRLVDAAATATTGAVSGDEVTAALAQSQKMEAIGKLAGGVAHDFNNLLTAIGLRVDELLLAHPVGDPSFEGLSQIREGVNKAAALVLQLLTFSTKATVRRVVLDLGGALGDFEVWLRRLLNEKVRLTTDYGREPVTVRMDRQQLEMAVMNLVVNARDALVAGGREGGEIHLSAGRLSAEAARSLGWSGVGEPDLALITVADNGPGIPSDVLDRIFEPFFTTKAPGEGTGLGLATVYGAVEQAQGWIIAQSPPGEGACFRIFLPLHVGEAEDAPPPPARPARDMSGAGRILLVEDADAVRDVAARVLRQRGYEVIEAADGEAALALAQAYAGRIDLMISDVSMPGMDGPALLRAARPALGAAPVIFISGYARSDFSDLLEEDPRVSFLPKPLDSRSLAERVKQALHA